MNTEHAGQDDTLPPRPSTRAHVRREIAAHFSGRISPSAERRLRTHLPSCQACRDRYERHLLIGGLDPTARAPALRIAAGLGLRFDQKGDVLPFWRRRLAALAVPLAAAAVLVFWVMKEPASPLREAGQSSEDFVARSARPTASVPPAFWIYRTPGGGDLLLVDHAIAAGDELAFAYTNPAGKAFLMIFGVDEHRHVFWFHPGWPPGQPAPLSIPAVAGPGPHELPAAIGHALDGRRLTVHAVWSDAPLSVNAVEEQVRAAAGADNIPSWGGGVVVTSRHLEVRP
jgi:hypothetical protein